MLKKNFFGYNFFVVLTIISLLPGMASAATLNNLVPTADGTYTDFNPNPAGSHYTNVDDSNCGDGEYNWTTTLNDIDSYKVDISSIAGNTINAIKIHTCASSGNTDNGQSSLQLFYRWNGTNGPLSAHQTFYCSHNNPDWGASSTFSGLSLSVDALSSLEIGAIYSSSTPSNCGIKIGAIKADVTY